MTRFDVAVVGAGPAGLAAAASAGAAGAKVLVIDEGLEPGGQYLRPPSTRTACDMAWMRRSPAQRRRQALLAELAQHGVEIRQQSCVVDIQPGWRLAVHGRLTRDVRWIDAACVVAATGARELTLPFPGWTLPGVMTLGGAQSLLKSQGVGPGRRVVLSGAGPFLWLVASQMMRAGVTVVAVAEATPLAATARFAGRSWRHPALALQAAQFWTRIGRLGSRFRFGHAVVAAEGQDGVERVTLAKLDRAWRPVPGTHRTIEADALCVSHGLLPATELTQLARVAHRTDPVTGAQLPSLDDMLTTSVAGLFAAGEAAGIGGGYVAELQGHVAGLAAAAQTGVLARDVARSRASQFRRRVDRRQRFVDDMAATYSAPACALPWADDDTLVCRCEEVPLHDIRAAIAQGDDTVDRIKSRTRCGMGHCQARQCGPLMQRVLAGQLAPAAFPLPGSIRQPLKPVPVADLCSVAAPS